jgi:type IV fimbrial biogenesis protein FimT
MAGVQNNSKAHSVTVLMRKQQNAFTLIELMVTLVVAAVVLTIAIPSFNQQIQNNRSLALGEDFVTALNFARSEAVKRSRPVTLCASNTTRTGCGTDWLNGWLAVVDTAPVDSTTPTVAEVLRVWESPPGNATVTVQRGAPGFTTGTNTGFVRYTGLGTHARIGGTAQSTRVVSEITGCRGDNGRTMTVGVAGTISAQNTACSAGG